MALRNGYSYGKIDFSDITEELRQIRGSDTDYITPSGRIFKLCFNGKYIEKKSHINKYNGYCYVGITLKGGKNKTRRLHRLVAEAYIENPSPEDYEIVGHKNNIKHDNRIENLYWTDLSENTQKAVDDLLMVNDKGIDDSQSVPIALYRNSGELVGVYGSISSAGRCISNFSKTSIAKAVDKSRKGVKGFYFVSITEEAYHSSEDSIKELQFDTKRIEKVKTPIEVFLNGVSIGVFESQKQIGRVFGIHQATVSSLVRSGRVHPRGYSFKRVYDELC